MYIYIYICIYIYVYVYIYIYLPRFSTHPSISVWAFMGVFAKVVFEMSLTADNFQPENDANAAAVTAKKKMAGSRYFCIRLT